MQPALSNYGSECAIIKRKYSFLPSNCQVIANCYGNVGGKILLFFYV